MVNKKPFVENLAVGKEIKEKKTWSNVKEEIDFSRLQPIDLSLQYRVFFITGKPGAGKSTYTLWSLDEYLRNKKMFNKIIFLNPDAYEQWAEDLYKYDSRETLLVVDALRRDGDTDKIFKKGVLVYSG